MVAMATQREKQHSEVSCPVSRFYGIENSGKLDAFGCQCNSPVLSGQRLGDENSSGDVVADLLHALHVVDDLEDARGVIQLGDLEVLPFRSELETVGAVQGSVQQRPLRSQPRREDALPVRTHCRV